MQSINLPDSIKEDYTFWHNFLENRITFSLDTSELHTREHEARVLLFALLIGEQLGLKQREKEMLCHAAVFHDTRRKDDGLDTGHGRRAATYYKTYCEKHLLFFHPWSYNIMAYHDLDDSFGEHAMVCEVSEREVLLYHIFKDADALDRYRLGPNGLDVRFLRTDAARQLTQYAHTVWESYQKRTS